MYDSEDFKMLLPKNLLPNYFNRLLNFISIVLIKVLL